MPKPPAYRAEFPPIPPDPAPVLPRHDASGDNLVRLKLRTDALAEELFELAFSREGPINAWKQQILAQRFLDEINNTPGGTNQLRRKLKAWIDGTKEIFNTKYWPQVALLQTDLHAAGVDLSPIQRAVALDDPRRVGLMLSVIGARIGKSPPFPRVLTQIEARAVVQGSGAVGSMVQIFADMEDSNSTDVAEALRKEFDRQGWNVNQTVLPTDKRNPALHGIHVIYPSEDMATVLENMTPAFEACELETTIEVRSMRQPPTIVKIEVWPSGNYQPKEGLPNLTVKPSDHPVLE